MLRLLFVIAITCGCLSVCTADENDNSKDSTPEAIFNERIMPIFRSPNPSSCVQCHLSSVDLKNYILPSHEKTFASLRDQGLINLERPSESKILKLITMGDEDRDQGAKLIHAEMRNRELEAFSGWIKACCKDEKLRNLPPLGIEERARPENPDEVIRHSRKSRVIESFVRNIWSQRLRCFPCHTQHEIKPNQKQARVKFEQWQEEYGDQMLIFKKTPAATIQYWIEQSKNPGEGNLPLINLDDPMKSLIILKPTAKLPQRIDGEFQPPSYNEPVSHMGGLKMHKDDHSYKSFFAWIRDYSKVVDGEYTSVKDLPADNWFATQRVLRVKDLPEDWKIGTPVQMFVHAMRDNGEWSEQPVAFTQGTVTPRRIVNGPLFLLGPTDVEKRAGWRRNGNPLVPGKYLVKLYVDDKGLLADDPVVLLGDAEFRGQIEIQNAKWRIGFPKAEFISATGLGSDP